MKISESFKNVIVAVLKLTLTSRLSNLIKLTSFEIMSTFMNYISSTMMPTDLGFFNIKSHSISFNSE